MILLWLLPAFVFICFGLIILRGAPYVPTHKKQLEKLFTMTFPLSSSDVVLDLGSGDGIVLQAAASKGAGALGYELNPFLALWSRIRLRRYSNVKVKVVDYLLIKNIPDSVTVVYAFTTSRSIKSIERKLLEWSRTRPLHFVSYGFQIPGKKPLRTSGPMHIYHFSPDKV